jgi:glutamyl-tRNA reductase
VTVIAVGINERDVPLAVFEQTALSEDELPKALQGLGGSDYVSEAVVLSTCLRTEVYAVVERYHDGLADVKKAFRCWSGDMGTNPSDASDPFTCWIDEAAATHLFEVAAGIDSPALGEGEILRQVRTAIDLARKEHASGHALGLLFRHAIEAGKRVRTETAIAQGTTSLAQAAVSLATDRLGGTLGGRSVLVVGAGEVGAGMAKALARSTPPARIVVANRSVKRAAVIAETCGGKAVNLGKLDEELARADLVLISTAAVELVLGLDRVAKAMAARPERPLLVVDVAVPRDVDPAVAGLDGVTLFDVEDVRRFAEAQMETRRSEIPAVRSLLSEELERYRVSTAARSAAPLVAALRARAETIRRGELERQAARLDALGPEAREIAEAITKRTISKLLHEPTVRLKSASGTPRGERMAEALRNLFDL